MDVETPAPAENPKPTRFSKRATPLLIVTSLVLALYFAPHLPWVRGLLLAQVESATRSAGYSLGYASSGGNPWWGLRLGGATVSGAGVNIKADQLRLGYFLPALLTGKLPLSVTAAGVRGSVAVGTFAPPAASGRASAVTPVLRELNLKDVSLELTDVPYTLPDLSVTNLQARPAGDDFRAEASLRTSEGEAAVTGTLSLNPLRFTADVSRADARLARQWWQGITGGTLSGTVNYANGRLGIDAAVEDGSLEFLGETVTGIRGSVTYQDATVSADLSGNALGGGVSATGGVDIAARRWSAAADGAVDVRDAALWLAAGRLPVDLSNLPLSGSAQTRLRASGWRDVTLSGEAEGAGRVAGYALDSLKVAYGFDTTDGARAEVTTSLAGGDVEAKLTPRQTGFSFDLSSAGVELLPTVTADLNVALEQTADGLSGTTDVALAGELLGESLQAALGGTLQPGVFEASLDGSALGGPLTGALTLQDGSLEGRLELPKASLPGLKRPVALELRADGPPDALPLRFALTTPEPTGIVLGPLVIPKDVGGQLTATLRGTRLADLSARFGTLSVAGDLSLNARDGALTYSLKTTPLSGVVNGEASVEGGVLTLAGGALTGEATVTSSSLRLPGMTLPPLGAAELSFGRADSWTATLTGADETLALAYDGSRLRATTAGYGVTVFGQTLTLTGTGNLAAQDLLGSLELELQGRTPVGAVTLAGKAEALRFGLAPPALGPGSQLAGTLSLLERTVTLNGQLGALTVTGTGGLDGERLNGALSVQGGGERLELLLNGNLARPELALNGRLPLNLGGELFGLPASGTLTADLTQNSDGYQGRAEVVGKVASVPVDLYVSGEGDGLRLTGSVTPFSVPVEVGGQLQPTLELSARSEVGTVTLGEAGRVTGGGTVPGGSFAGFTLAPQPWTLGGDLGEGTATLALPETASRLTAERGAAGWQANLDLNQTLTRGDSTVRLDAAGDVSADGSRLSGALTVQTPAGDAALPVTGSLTGLELTGNLPAPVAASLFGLPVTLTGDLKLSARVQLADGFGYTATTAWQTPDSTLTAQLEGSSAGVSITAAGPGLSFRYSPERLTVKADAFQVGPFLAAAGVQGGLSGSLSRTQAGWAGALTLAGRAPVALQAVLSGAGEGLDLRADYDAGALNAHADGTLLPTLDVALSGAFDLATLQGRAGGTLARPDVAATLTTRPVEVQNGLELTVPAQTVALTADLADGLKVHLQGDTLDLELAEGALQGWLRLPFTVAGEPQVLSAELGGKVANPTVSGALAGAVVSGPVTFAEGAVATTLQIDPSPWLNSLGLPLAAPALTVTFEAERDLSWQAQVEGSATALKIPLGVSGLLTGKAARYRGEASVSAAGERVLVTVTGQGSEVQADAVLDAVDLASLAPALPVTLTGALGGTLRFDTEAPQPLSFDLATTGAVQGRAFKLAAKRKDGENLSIAADLAGTPVTLSDEAGAYLLNLGSGEGPLNLTGRLEFAPTVRFAAAGRYLSQPVTVTAAYATDAATWSASVGGATFQGSARRADGAWALYSSANGPAGGPSPFTGQAEVAARVADGQVGLDTLTATTTLAGRAVTLELSGPAWPAPNVTGSLAVAGFERSSVAITSIGIGNGAENDAENGAENSVAGYGLTLNYAGLNLNADFSSGFALAASALYGEGTVPVGDGVALSADLTWTADQGFGGKAAAELAVGDAGTVNLTAVGTGPLGVAARAVFRDQEEPAQTGQEVAQLDLTLADNPLARPDLTGRLTVQGSLGRLLPAYRTLTPAPTTLSGEFDVTGEVGKPRLGGKVALEGALNAAGDFVWDGDEGRLELSGAGLDAVGELDAAGWSASARADALELGALLPQLEAPRLGATVTGNGIWGETPTLQTDALRLQTPNGSLAGNLKYDGTLSGRLEADLALADLNLGPALQGRVAGDLLLSISSGADTGPSLSGTLQASSLGFAGQTATLDGDLIVTGALTAPEITLSLRGAGSASGTLFANVSPGKGSYAVTSTLKVGALASDFAVNWVAADLTAADLTAADLAASGEVAYRDYALTVGSAPGSAGNLLSLTGRGRLEGWQLDLAPEAARLDLRGPLAGLSETLAGSVALGATWPSGREASLSGTIRSLQVGPVGVGEVSVNSSGRTLNLAGDNLAATVSLQSGVAWNVERLAVKLPGDLALEAAGRGTLTRADVRGDLSGQLQGEAFEIPAALTYRRGTVTVTSDAELFGGRLALNARGSAAAGWQGKLVVENLKLSGVTASLAGDLNGPLQAPELSAALSLSPPASPDTTFQSTVTASTSSLKLAGDLESPLLGEPLQVAGTLSAAPELTLTSGGEHLTLSSEDGLLTAAGALELAAGPVRVQLTARPDAAAGEDVLALTLSVPSLAGLTLTSALPKVAPAALPAVLAEGLVLQGSQNTGGSVALDFADGPSAALRGVTLQTPEGSIVLSGRIAPGAGRLTGRWQGSVAGTATLPWLAALTNFGFQSELVGDSLSVSAVGDGSYLDARYDLGTRNGTVNAALDSVAGSAQVELAYTAARGPSGSVTFRDFPVFSSPATGDARLGATLTLTPEALSGAAGLELGDGTLALEGSLGLASVLPEFVPQGAAEQNVTARFTDFDLKNVPWVARVLPYLTAPLTGEAALRNGELSGRLTAPLTVAERVLPLSLSLGGAFGRIEAQGEVGRSSFTLSRSGGTVAGLVRFVDFPLDRAVAAVAGPRAVSAQLTGALRFEIPGGSLQNSYIRFSSERFVLEEGGVVTQGDLSFELQNGALSIQKAAFEGVGRWQASGVASRERLSLRFDALEADFSPLLRLVPQLAGLNVGAFGTVQLVTSGSLVNPVVKANSPELKLSLGGSAYRLSDAAITVQNSDFVTSGRLNGVAPLGGSVTFSGGGQVKLAAPRSFDLTLRFKGDPEVPVLGTLEDVQGTVSVRPGESWQLATTGVLGNPFELSGSLSPLDLQLTGQGLNVRAPQFFLASSVTDTNLRFFRSDSFHLSGSLLTRQATLDLESRRETAANSSAAATGAAAAPDPAPRSRSPFLARLNFDDLSLTAPQQISFSENFGSGELGDIDLVLGGTAAKPSLSGSARALRGTVRFAGRDFTLQRALATFEPAQGLYPTLQIDATTRFDKLQVLNGLADQVNFVEPSGSADFAVTLNLTGGVAPNPEGPKPFTVDITPSLSSDAVIELSGAPGTRPLSVPELFSLLTLGKLELSPEFAQGGLATSLAQGALDTAVDFLILSELQRGLGDALGLDLLEIRTTPLGSLLTGDNEPFGVSLRLGGYLSDEVFASFEIGSLGVGADVALRNAFNVRYSLGALEFSLAGRLDFYRDAGLEPLPEIDLNLAYRFSPLVRLETGLELSTAKQGVRFGVSLRW